MDGGKAKAKTKPRGLEVFVMRETSTAPAPCRPERGTGNRSHVLDLADERLEVLLL